MCRRQVQGEVGLLDLADTATVRDAVGDGGGTDDTAGVVESEHVARPLSWAQPATSKTETIRRARLGSMARILLQQPDPRSPLADSSLKKRWPPCFSRALWALPAVFADGHRVFRRPPLAVRFALGVCDEGYSPTHSGSVQDTA